MKEEKRDQTYILQLRVLFAASFFLTGLFYEAQSAAVSIALLIVLIRRRQRGSLHASWNLSLVAVLLVWLGYLGGALWGVDGGIALWGAVKYLPVVLFALCLLQTDAGGRRHILGDIPRIGAVMTAVTFLLQLIPQTASYVTVSGRMAGFFQYPNTFASFVLIGIVIVLMRKEARRFDLPVLAVLVFGLLQAGSRSIYLIAMPVVIPCIVIRIREHSVREHAGGTAHAGGPAAARLSGRVSGKKDRKGRKDVSLQTSGARQDHQSTGGLKNPFLLKRQAGSAPASGYWILSAAIAAAVGAVMSIAASLAGYAVVSERATTISANASTFLGRLLYWKDALGVILEHPFGLGYLGYYMTQGSFQTGVYSVRFVHNDFLQLFLDTGWVPALFAAVAVIGALISKRLDACSRMVLIALLAHCLVDFDLEFVAMYFILLLCLDWEAGRSYALRLPPVAGVLLSAAAGVFGIYIGVVSSLTYAGRYDAASALCPWDTFSNLELLALEEDEEEMADLADRILAQNESCAAAWDAKAYLAYSEGNFTDYITYKRSAISCNRYDITEYEDYFSCLKVGVELYLAADDTDSATACMVEIVEIGNLLDALEEETDPLAYRLADTPDLTMPEAYEAYLNQAQE